MKSNSICLAPTKAPGKGEISVFMLNEFMLSCVTIFSGKLRKKKVLTSYFSKFQTV